MAIIDGTAPHERDAVIPGAVDELVPLGIAFDISGLEGHRESIENLNAKKNEAYLNAYRDLSFSSEFDEKIKAEILKTFDFNAARESAYQLYRDISSCFSDNDRADLRLISSFSKEGYSSLSLSNSLAERTYGISGKFGSELIFMKLLYELLVQKNVKFRYFPSPLLPDEIEAIAFTDSRTVIRITNENAYIDTEIFLKSDMIGTRTEALALLSGGRDHFLNEAQNYLSLASEYHFKLEEIYTRHMTFDIVNRMTDELLEKVKNILSR